MSGVCSYRAVADHHFTWMRHPKSRVNVLNGNHFYEEIVDAGRISRMAFKIDLVINEKEEIIRAFAGDPEKEHQEASKYAESATKALALATFCTRTGGAIIWVAPQKEAGPIMPLIREMASPESATDFRGRLRGEMCLNT